MGGKKQGMTIFAGSLKSHWLKYINEVQIKTNPCDNVGMSANLSMTR